MAKAAKQVEGEISERVTKSFVKGVLDHYENIESARGKFMNSARKERDAMTALYEGMAARGVSQKASKTEIKIIRAIERIKGWVAELEAEDRKMVQKLAKAQGDKKQLSLLLEVPMPKPEKPSKEERDENVVELRAGNGNDTQPAA
jgi:hypothetical protein